MRKWPLRIWDGYHARARINLVVCGSIDRLIGRIFKDDQAPLYGRNTAEFRIEPFGVPLLTVLSSIASGRTRRTEIEQALGGSGGGYITKLEGDYALVAKRQPPFEKSANKNCVYAITDNFLRFWFRFVWKYAYLLELRYHEELRGIILRDYKAFSGPALESYFRAKFVGAHAYTKIGGWWDRKGENEIDLVCENEFANKLDFYEVKRDASRFDRALLARKVDAFFAKNPSLKSHEVTWGGLSMDDM